MSRTARDASTLRTDPGAAAGDARPGGRRRWLLAVAALALALSALSLSDAHGFRLQRKLDAQIRERQQQNLALEQENARLAREIRALDGDPHAVERAAREELGFVKPDEVVFTF